MIVPFEKSSYLAQVRRLRSLAEVAVTQFPLKAKEIHFINHGENTTFRIVGAGKKQYLLRIHRNDYHSPAAIEEELEWLVRLAKNGLSNNSSTPKPIVSKRGKLIENVAHPGLSGSRNCCVFEWIDGRLIGKIAKPQHLFAIGRMLAELQLTTTKTAVRHRHYWSAEGLVGDRPKFGSIDKILDTTPREQKLITKARKTVLQKLRKFETQFPKRCGLIHADLHFGNLLETRDGLGAIDFDDCGYGFHAYDLMIPYISVMNWLGEKRRDRLPDYKAALIEGYRTKKSWDADDEKILPALVIARRLMMLGWLNSRSDNPKLRKYLRTAIDKAIDHIHAEE